MTPSERQQMRALTEALHFAYAYVGRLAIEEEAGNVPASVLPASLAMKKIEGVLIGVSQKIEQKREATA